MSAIEVDEYITVQHRDDQARLLAERTKILRTASQKAQDKTLTLEETNDLFAKFNETYKRRSSHLAVSKSDRNVDESWALKLMKESEQEELLEA